jgi:Flp pilus assembly pilin Flp
LQDAKIGSVKKLTRRFYRLKIWTDCRGQDLLEYALMAGMVVTAAVAAMLVLSGAVNNMFIKIGSIITNTVH